MKSEFLSKIWQAFRESQTLVEPASSTGESGISSLLRKAAASGGSAFEVEKTAIEKADIVGVESAVPSRESPVTGSPGDRRRYTIGNTVAHGGMGTILHARDLNLRRTVAMKVILPGKEDSEQYTLRFMQEAQLTAQLEHPNIVPVHELGTSEQGKPFYTMKFVQGTTLHDLLEKIKAGDPETMAVFSLAHLLTIFQKVCDAVAFTHSRGVIHRDLKPENIMIGEYGEVLVMD
jgi:serine/threonine protein kinase